MQVYAAMIDRLDQNIGRLVKALRELGKLQDTLFLFASDNGASAEVVEIGEGQIGDIDRWSSQKGRWANVSNTPFRKYKNHSHEGGITSPLIAHWPAGIKQPGRIVREASHFVDVMPTLIELGGASYPETLEDALVPELDGASLLPLLAGEDLQRGRPLFWSWGKSAAIREGRWKLVRPRKGGPWELYDMRVDRTETNDIAGEHPRIVNELSHLYESWAS